MSVKKAFYTQKDFSKERQENYSKKIDQYIPNDKVRILQSNLVFVNALPSDTSTKETLQRDVYFGRYGPVNKLILNPPYPNKKGITYQAYVTYSSQLDASLAIVSLDGYKLSDRPLKVSFGTTKYCSHFIRGHDCPNPDCFYLHKVDKKKEVANGDSKIIFKQQNSKAMNVVLNSLEQIINRIIDSDNEQEQQGFPSLSELLDYLVDKQYVTQTEIDQIYEEVNSKRQPVIEPPPFQQRFSLPDPRKQERSQQNQKLTKSNSFSTVGSPSKQTNGVNDEQIFCKSDKQQLKQKCQKIICQLKQNIDKQNALGDRQLEMQQKIQKLIIKQVLKKGNNQCRSRFIKNATATREDISKLKGIVQKYLIAHN